MSKIKDGIKRLVYNGYSVEYQVVSISDVSKYRHGKESYQVYANHSKLKFDNKKNKAACDGCFTKIYSDIDEAVDKFLGLKEFLYGG